MMIAIAIVAVVMVVIVMYSVHTGTEAGCDVAARRIMSSRLRHHSQMQ